MAGLDDITDLETFETVLQGKARELLDFLDKGDFTSAMQILAELSEARSAMLYREVGRLTRGLHEALKEFNIDVGKSAPMQGSAGVADASEAANANERLNYVLELTEKAANSTMDMVDASMPIAEELGEQARLLRGDWKQMADRESSLSELKDLGRTTESFLLQIEKGSDALQKNFTDILLAQGFQDITGQLIKRVIGLVNEVESSLVKLVSVAGQVDRISGINQDAQLNSRSPTAKQEGSDLRGHGPQVPKQESADVVAGQDDVDDLLSSLGF